MKKLLPLIILLCLNFGAKATHLMGGEIVITHLTGSDYEVRLTHYRDTIGIALAAHSDILVDVLDTTTNHYINMYSNMQVPLNPTYTIPLLPSFPYGIEVGVYIDTISLLPGEYRISNRECCRNGAIHNMASPLTEGLGLYTDFTVPNTAGLSNNSSPDFLLMPVSFFPNNTAINYNPLPFDIDNDSLSWGLNIPYNNVATNVLDTVDGFVPPLADPTGPFTMNPVTGEITWTPNTLGNMVQSFQVDEYRSGVKTGSIVRDYQYVVIPPPFSNRYLPQTEIQSNDLQYNSVQNYYYLEYFPGVQLTFDVHGTDADSNSQLSMISSSEIFHLNNPATFTTNSTTNTITGTFSWTPPTGYDKNVIVVFRLRDGLWTTDFTLRLQPGDPQRTHTVDQKISGIKVYPNPSDDNFTISLDNLEANTTQIELHNYLGQKVDNIFEGKLPRGHWDIQYTEDLPAGVYLIRVSVDGTPVQSVPLMVR